jgi:hypothetical protein
MRNSTGAMRRCDVGSETCDRSQNVAGAGVALATCCRRRGTARVRSSDPAKPRAQPRKGAAMIRTKSATIRQTAPRKILILHKTTLKHLSGGTGDGQPSAACGGTESIAVCQSQTMS